MRGWLLANLFLLGMAMLAASILFIGAVAVRFFHVDESTERTLIGWTAILAIIVSAFIARAALSRIERKR